ncbi:MAG: SHOCT domain-containing protein [Melioribacteraceae bacterium]|nr:SHOCT domain-containing protein [Melioribacteraceae bacterium]MCF8353212.1 SHOCT domain-containing protein [Melioribacteraceae bacterium]MCF8395603.1 SHOCT domain-containing protein [Melioribacteraceae bacterium]MCF8418754.1 SHOCT domain-containing protein [Melioribacteraceae bacterium]
MFHDGFMGGMSFGWLFWIVVIVLVVYLIVRFANQQNTRTTSNESALDILKKRYARGEITKEEFDEMKNDLN